MDYYSIMRAHGIKIPFSPLPPPPSMKTIRAQLFGWISNGWADFIWTDYCWILIQWISNGINESLSTINFCCNALFSWYPQEEAPAKAQDCICRMCRIRFPQNSENVKTRCIDDIAGFVQFLSDQELSLHKWVIQRNGSRYQWQFICFNCISWNRLKKNGIYELNCGFFSGMKRIYFSARLSSLTEYYLSAFRNAQRFDHDLQYGTWSLQGEGTYTGCYQAKISILYMKNCLAHS